jgi:hypothetical protein
MTCSKCGHARSREAGHTLGLMKARPDRLRDVIAHILTVSVVRRRTVIGVLRELGVGDAETRDPIEWERLIATQG